MTMEDTDFRRKRKEDAKLKKRQRIEESGGVRPRAAKTPKQNEGESVGLEKSHVEKSTEHAPPRNFERKPLVSSHGSKPSLTGHRFGRVMEKTPCRNKPRFSTVSIALPGSVLSNCQTRELRTLLVGQIARAATIYHVDEVIVFDDKLGKTNHRSGGWRRNLIRDNRKHDSKEGDEEPKKEIKEEPKEEANDKADGEGEEPQQERRPRSTPQEFMARLLQYCECPQYLRRHFFPMHPDLQFAGLLAPVDAPHHVREGDASKYREGVVLQKKSPKGGSLVNCGIRNRPVAIDRKIAPGIRCTVKIDPTFYGKPGVIKGTVVSPAAPREEDGSYWGYTTRLATSINDVFDGCPFEGGYDLKIGTSERGDKSVEEKSFNLPKFEHSLIVFGGVAGIEECVDADESIRLPGSQSNKLFDMWLNTCPYQGSRTVRTEEAVLISLAQLSLPLANSAHHKQIVEETPEVEFSDASPSDESSEGGKSGSEGGESGSEDGESGSDDGKGENDEKFNDEK